MIKTELSTIFGTAGVVLATNFSMIKKTNVTREKNFDYHLRLVTLNPKQGVPYSLGD